MVLLGITGGIGMGKSMSAQILSDLGFPVVDTDVIAREVVSPGEPALLEIRQAFGDEVFQPDGKLDRARLAQIAFGTKEARCRLESILHPRIRAVWEQRTAEWRVRGLPLGAVIIPLLYETGAERAFEAVACVACSAATQLHRLHQRGWNDEHAKNRLAAQWPVEEKVLHADFVIWTEPPIALHEQQWRCILETLGVPVPTPTQG